MQRAKTSQPELRNDDVESWVERTCILESDSIPNAAWKAARMVWPDCDDLDLRTRDAWHAWLRIERATRASENETRGR